MKFEEKIIAVGHLLNQKNYLLLLDNLETAENAAGTIFKLQNLIKGKTQALVTSRNKIQYGWVHQTSLHELDLEDTTEFLEREARKNRIPQILNASEEIKKKIWTITGSAPLALKLVCSQGKFLDLEPILNQLHLVRNNSNNIYPYIYKRTWTELSDLAKYILIYIGRTVSKNICLEELSFLADNETEDDIISAITQLDKYSLLKISAVEEQGHRYSIHQLTRQFVNSTLPEFWKY